MKNKRAEDYEDQTCLRRLLGYCSHCERDYDSEHSPNNLDCLNYTPHYLSSKNYLNVLSE